MNIAPEVIEVVRLNTDVYNAFSKQFNRVHVDDNTSPLQAGFQLGIQKVLEALRKDIVVKVQ